MDIRSTLSERGKTHGNWNSQSNFQMMLHDMFSTLGWSPSMRAGMMAITMKQSRIAHGDPFEPDHWRDIAGYATLVADELEREQDPAVLERFTDDAGSLL